MLSLTIREGEYVMIGDSIKVHFNRKKGKDLVLGVEAPREVKITRSQAYEGETDKLAEQGDWDAIKLSHRLKQEHAERRQKIKGRTA